jgi:hypothetical protein
MHDVLKKGRLVGALLGTMALLALGLILGPVSAQASTSPYCGGVLAPSQWCHGAARWLYQNYGWADNAGVCVALSPRSELYCVGSANTGVYSANAGSNIWVEPVIVNPAGYNNYVHGVSLTH